MNYHSTSTAALPPAKTIDIEGIKTSYHVAGTGQPIVFIYGGNFGTADSAPSAHAWLEADTCMVHPVTSA